jgi:hypothetical protein
MENISITQALGVWSELEQAYYGDNGYGGDTAEIYAYRLQSYNPSASLMPQESEFGFQAKQEQAELAGKSLYSLIKKFCELRDCSIEVESADPEILLRECLVHRCHVRVLRNK